MSATNRVTAAAREPIGCFPSSTDRDGFPTAEANVPDYALAISTPDRHRLEDPFAPADLSVPGTFTAGGRSWAVHISTHSLRTGSPRSWDIRFPADDRFDCGRERVELVSHGAGRLKLGADLAAAVGAPAPSARIVELTVNGVKVGAYTELESVSGAAFLEAHGFDRRSAIYLCDRDRCDATDITGNSRDEDELPDFLAELESVPADKFTAWAEENLDLDGFLAWHALELAFGQGDGRGALVFDHEEGKVSFVPLAPSFALPSAPRVGSADPLSDPSLGAMREISGRESAVLRLAVHRSKQARATPASGRPSPLVRALLSAAVLPLGLEASEAKLPRGWNVLAVRISHDPKLRTRLLATIDELLEERFSEAVLRPRFERLAAQLSGHRASIATQLSEGRERLVAEKARLEAIDAFPLRISEVDRGADGKPYVELQNVGESEVSLDGRVLRGTLGGAGLRLEGTIAPGEARAYLAGEGERSLSLDPQAPAVGLFEAKGEQPLAVHFGPTLD